MLFFTPDGKSILFYEGKQLVLRNVLTGEINHTIDLKRYELVSMFHVRFSPDGKQLLLMMLEESPRLLDAATGEEVLVFEHPELEWAIWGEFTDDGRSVLAGGPYDDVYRWDTASGRVMQTYHHERWGFYRFAVSRDNRYLVGGGGWSEAGIGTSTLAKNCINSPLKTLRLSL